MTAMDDQLISPGTLGTSGTLGTLATRKCYNPWHLPMADPQTSGPRRSEAPPGAEDEARIEHLLVTGLDHYFAGEFEEAINLWTRVLFLDRNHDRARAYIDRARSAQAEQQRISEALVHEGLEAFDRGEVVRARALLSDALDQGASHDVALGVLGRIDRLDAGTRPAAPAAPSLRKRAARKPASADANQRRGTIAMWWITAAAIVIVGAIAFVLVAPNGLAMVPGAGHDRRAGRACHAAVTVAVAVADGDLCGAGAIARLRAASCATRCARSIASRSATRCDRTRNVFVPTFNENCWPWPAPKRHRHRPSPLQFRHLANEVS